MNSLAHPRSLQSLRSLHFPAVLLTAASTLLLLSPCVFAQSGPPAEGAHFRHWAGARAGFRGGLHGMGKVVTGAPYTAQAVTTTAQTLSNGTQISRKIVAEIARDNEGRTMRSQTVSGFGGNGANAGATIVTIFDPVANERIEYNEKTRRARIFVLPPSAASGAPARRWGKGGRFHSSANVQKTSLGSQNMDGLSVTGVKITRTIPAGKIGNSQPIVSTDERWYSPDLQMVIQSSRNDPRFGQTTYTVQNLQRSEPPASLFQVPAGYQTRTVDLPAHHGAR